MILLEAKNVCRKIENIINLHDVNFQIEEGEFIGLIGPEKSGKSALIRCINRTGEVDEGEILYKNKNILSQNYAADNVRKSIGTVYREANLFRTFTVAENIMRPLMDLKKKSVSEAYKTAISLLEKVGLSELAEEYPDKLTDGQKQRVSIMRTVAMDPEIILFDEPTSLLAPTMREEVLTVIRELAGSKKYTIIMATHEMDFVQETAGRVFFMIDGTVHETGTPDRIFNNPERARTKYFIKRYRYLELLIGSRKFDVLGFITEINVFALRQMVPKEMLNKTQHIFEELCINILLKWKDTPIEFVLGYDSRKNECELRLSYDGDMKYNPMEDGIFDEDDFALAILKAMLKSYEYRYWNSKNKITIIF